MDDNREERPGASSTPGGATPAEASRPLTRRELRLAAQAELDATGPQDGSGPTASQGFEPVDVGSVRMSRRAAPEPTDTGPVPHPGRAIGQLARAGTADGAPGGPLAAPAWTPVGVDGASSPDGRAPRTGGVPVVPARQDRQADADDGAPGLGSRVPLTRRRVREAVRDAPAPSAVAPARTDREDGATGRSESETPTSETPVVVPPAMSAPPRSAPPSSPAQPSPPQAAPPQPSPPMAQDAPEAPAADPLRSPTLPSVLPDEPDVDDVRWEGPVPPSQVVRTPVARRAAPRVAPLADDVEPTGPVPVVVPAAGRPGPTAPPRPPVVPDAARPPVPSPAMSFGPTWTIRGPGAPSPANGARTSGARSAPTGPVAAGRTAGGVEDATAATPAPDAAAGARLPELPLVPPVGRVRPADGPGRADGLPTLDDLLASRPRPASGPAELGWRAVVRRASGGLLSLPPGPEEQQVRESVAAVQRRLDGPRTVVVINPKGGAHKTTATLLLAATFGSHRGGSALAWDNNETRGTLGWRSEHGAHQRTAVDLLDDLHRFEDPTSARVGDLDAYVRSQSAQFDVLASDEDAASAASIDAFAFRSLHRTLQRFYRVMVVDTGNNMRASNWQAAIEAADQVVVVSTVREDTSQSAAWALDALRAAGKEDVVRRAVTVLSDPATRRDAALHQRLHDHFGRLTRVVLDVPYDPSLVSGGPLDVDALSRQTREAWLHVAAAVADGL